MRSHRNNLLALLLSLPLLMAADCGHGGGSPCQQRAQGYAEGPDAGAGFAEDDPEFAEDGANEAIGTGGGGGGGSREECRQQ